MDNNVDKPFALPPRCKLLAWTRRHYRSASACPILEGVVSQVGFAALTQGTSALALTTDRCGNNGGNMGIGQVTDNGNFKKRFVHIDHLRSEAKLLHPL